VVVARSSPGIWHAVRPWTMRVNRRLLPETSLIECVSQEINQINAATRSRKSRQ
jgi:hypothetical protein